MHLSIPSEPRLTHILLLLSARAALLLRHKGRDAGALHKAIRLLCIGVHLANVVVELGELPWALCSALTGQVHPIVVLDWRGISNHLSPAILRVSHRLNLCKLNHLLSGTLPDHLYRGDAKLFL